MKRMRQLLAVTMIGGATLWACSALAAPSGMPAQLDRTQEAPSRSVVLGEGKVRQLRWRILAFGRDGPGGGPNVCFLEENLLFGGFSRGVECGQPAPPGDDSLFTQFSASFDRTPGEKVGVTSAGLAFSRDVRRVEVRLNSGRSLSRRTRLLNEAQSQRSGLAPFRFLVFGLSANVCLSKIVGFDSAGAVLFRQSRRCEGQEPPTEVEASS
jgi:hypothetical protein